MVAKAKSKRVPSVKQCDYGHDTTGSVRRLDTGGGSGAFLCRVHWNKEMAWRKARNKGLEKQNRFSIRKFPG